ncbi:hypothetical protein BT96DRAFT_88048 [Gymnopus androsaceus JB14]|uniref:Uncharacterized protein n=1 Tax=Gymnopus androsaceus JB14 TaxID=1447944 RepID=A0A6A4GCX0_9AGAR|nr:hypothetical protein BT96DRAFT_88048 [Gymnopus androsaceus JB14]
MLLLGRIHDERQTTSSTELSLKPIRRIAAFISRLLGFPVSGGGVISGLILTWFRRSGRLRERKRRRCGFWYSFTIRVSSSRPQLRKQDTELT